MKNRRKIAALSLLVLTVSFGVLLVSGWPSLKGPFYLDSEGYFRSLPYFSERSLTWEKVHDVALDNPYPGGKRIIPNLTFVLENNLLGFTPATGRVVNMLLHALNLTLVFLLLRSVLLLLGKNGRLAIQGAALGAFLWGLNPLFADTTYYVIQRMTILAGTFYLAALLLYLRGRSSSGLARWVWLAGTFLAFLFGMMCKENVVLLPLGIAVLEFILPGSEAATHPSRRIWVLLAVFVAASPILAMVLHYDLKGVVESVLNPRGRFFTSPERILTEGRVMVHYLSLLLFPVPGRFSLVMKYRLSKSIINPPVTLLAWFAILSLVFLAVKWRKRHPLFSLAVLWFFVNQLLESTVIPLEIAFLHRNYIPSIFLFLPVVWALLSLEGKRAWMTVRIVAISVLMLFVTGLYTRAMTWGVPKTFWEDVIRKSPGSLRGYINLGIYYDVNGDPIKALRIYNIGAKAAFEEDRGFWGDLYANMGIARMKMGEDIEAERYLDRALSITLNDDYLYNMAFLQIRMKKPARAKEALDLLEGKNPRYPDLHLLRAKLLLLQGSKDLAKKELETELSLYPGQREAIGLLRSLEK